MPYELNYERDGSGVVIKWTGVVSGRELYAVNALIYAGEQLPILRYQIWDSTNAEKLEASPSDVRNIATQDAKAASQNPNLIAALVGSTDFFYGLQRIYMVFTEVWANGYKAETFSNMEQARAWIAKKYPDS